MFSNKAELSKTRRPVIIFAVAVGLTLIALVPFHMFSPKKHSATRPPDVSTAGLNSVAKFALPVVFEPNEGQSAPEASFLSRTPGYTLFLTSTTSVMTFRASDHSRPRYVADVDASRRGRRASAAPTGSFGLEIDHLKTRRNSSANVLRAKFLGANPQIRPEGQKLQSGKSNYFKGNDPAKWLRQVPHYAQVRYRNIYSGIDLVYHGNDGQLEYDFLVAPGANPDSIQLALDGVQESVHADLDADGDLSISVGEDQIVLHNPDVYQGTDCRTGQGTDREFLRPTSGCKLIPGGRFQLRKRRHDVLISFALPAYDHSQPLVIDPVLSFSTFLSDPNNASTNGVAVDAAGNIYVVGTGGVGFPITEGAYQVTPNGNGDLVIFKMSSDGSHLIYSTYLGGSGGAAPSGIAIDAAGNAYVTGVSATDFPTVNQIGPVPLVVNAFVSKLSADGSNLLYSTLVGGSLEGAAKGITVDAAGEAVVVGRTYSSDYPTTPGAIEPTQNGNGSGFITKISADGSAFVFSTFLGGNSAAEATGVGVDPSGNIYVTGLTGSNFPVTPGAFQTTCPSKAACAFVVKANPAGTALVYSSYLGVAEGRAIAVNAGGNAYVTGLANAAQPFPTTPGVFQPQPAPFCEVFVTEFSADGSSLVFSTFLGGQNDEMGEAIALDSAGNVYVAGETASFDFPIQNAIQPTYAGDGDSFLSALNSSGSQLLFSTFLGGSYTEYAAGVAVDPIGNIYYVGGSSSADFPIVNALQPAPQAIGNDTILKLTNQPDFTIMASSPVVSVAAGQTATYSLTLTPQNGFNQTVALTCAGAPSNSSCTVSPTTVTLNGSGSATATVSVKTVARSVLSDRQDRSRRISASATFGSVWLIGCALALPFAVRRRAHCRRALALSVFLMLLMTTLSCGGGPSSNGGGSVPTAPGAYALTVTGAGPNNLDHPVQLGLIVN